MAAFEELAAGVDRPAGGYHLAALAGDGRSSARERPIA
jgi:hypothetical protein